MPLQTPRHTHTHRDSTHTHRHTVHTHTHTDSTHTHTVHTHIHTHTQERTDGEKGEIDVPLTFSVFRDKGS